MGIKWQGDVKGRLVYDGVVGSEDDLIEKNNTRMHGFCFVVWFGGICHRLRFHVSTAHSRSWKINAMNKTNGLQMTVTGVQTSDE